MTDSNYETQESPSIKSDWQEWIVYFLKKTLNNVLKARWDRWDRFFDSLLWIRTKLFFFQSSRNAPSFIVDFNGKIIELPQVLIIFIDNWFHSRALSTSNKSSNNNNYLHDMVVQMVKELIITRMIVLLLLLMVLFYLNCYIKIIIWMWLIRFVMRKKCSLNLGRVIEDIIILYIKRA